MTAALPRVIYDKTAQLALADLELLMEVSQRLEDVGERLACFELVLAEADQIDDPIVGLHQRLDGLSARLTALDAKQRRPFPVQLYVNDPPAEKRPAIDLHEAVEARDRMAVAIKKLDEELRALNKRFDEERLALTKRFANMAGELDYLCGQELRQKFVRVTDTIEDLVDDRLDNRDTFSALQGWMATLEMKLSSLEEKFNNRLDKCATEFSKMREVQAAIVAKLGVTEGRDGRGGWPSSPTTVSSFAAKAQGEHSHSRRRER